MKKHNVGFLAHGPASGNSLIPLINELEKNENINVFKYPYHAYVAELWGLDYILPHGYHPDSLYELDVLVYGTGSGHDTEIKIPLTVQNTDVRTVSILDCYWGDDESLFERFITPPDYILTPSKCSYDRLIALNIMDSDNILPYGNPHYDRLHEYKGSYTINYPLDIAFFSQCTTTEDFSDTSEYSKEALTSMIKLQKKYPKLIGNIYVSPHPREDIRWLHKQCDYDKIIFNVGDSTELMLRTDVAYGVKCTLQYESEMIGKPVIFYNDYNTLKQEIKTITTKEFPPKLMEGLATTKCIKFIVSLLKPLTVDKMINLKYKL